MTNLSFIIQKGLKSFKLKMDNKVLMSPIKREILKKKLQQERKLQMRAALPVLTRDEIRR